MVGLCTVAAYLDAGHSTDFKDIFVTDGRNIRKGFDTMPIVVLDAGRDPHHSRKRDQVLSAAGYKVVTAHNSPDIINNLFEGDFDVVILCNSLPSEERRRLARIINSYSPSTPVVVLADSADVAEYDYGTLTSNSSPEWIVAAIRTVTEANTIPIGHKQLEHKQRGGAATRSQKAS